MRTFNGFIIFAILSAIWPTIGRASGLEVDTYSKLFRPYQPLQEFLFEVKGVHIEVDDGQWGYLYHGDKLLYKGTLKANNFDMVGGKIGQIEVWFDEGFLLDLGESYTVVIPKDVYRSVDDPAITNDEVRFEFEVPAVIGQPNYHWGPVVTSAVSFGFSWPIETEPVGDPRAYLYREDELLGAYRLKVDFDWDYGQASFGIGKTFYFDKDVEYSIVIPAGSISAFGREELVNEEIVVKFIGGWDEYLENPALRHCGFRANCMDDDSREIRNARFYFDVPIAFSTDKPVMQLVEDVLQIAEVTPTLSMDNGYWTVEADFGAIPIKEKTAYIFVIPEGILQVDGDEMVVNRDLRYGILTSSWSKIEVGYVGAGRFTVDGRILNFEGLRSGSRICVAGLDGRIVARAAAASPSMSLTLPSPGVYIVSIDGSVSKVAVR